MDDSLLLGFAISADFERDGVCFAADRNGLRRSDDGGRTWTAAFESADVAATAVAAGHDGFVAAAVAGGIGRSEDGGVTWRFTRLPPPAPLIAAIALADDGAMVAGTMQDGVLISDDGGESWEQRNAGLFDADVRGVAVSPRFGERLVVSAGTGTGLFRSANRGRLWRAWGDLPAMAPIAGLATTAGGSMIASVEELGLWRSDAAGAKWRRIGENMLPDEIEMIVTLPESGRIVVTGDDAAFRSNDGGETWIRVDGLVEGLHSVAAGAR